MGRRKPNKPKRQRSSCEPLDQTPVVCPDCAAVIVPGAASPHQSGCPFIEDLYRAHAADLEWFESHPGTETYYREPSWSEKRYDLGNGRDGNERVTRVMVSLIRPGSTIRGFMGADGMVREIVPQGFTDHEIPVILDIYGHLLRR